ncbi:class I SAM-dependent methyltransferase [Methylophilus flavus]|uniref:Class I SAM-dependent methyltransferase n=1 Tax=Methylophilus flavus TaxID=640084 RepID=A0ABW3PAA7_9PROT
MLASRTFWVGRNFTLQHKFTPIQSYYASRASEYDAVYEKPERQIDLRSIEQWLPSILQGKRILEIACGTGYWTQFIAPEASSIYAIDSAEETLQIARQRIPASNVSFAIDDAYAPRTDERTFNAAFAGFWFSHVLIERQIEFLTGLNKALQPGAKVLLLDNVFVEGSSSAICERDKFGNTYQSRTLADGSRHKILKNFPSADQLHALVANGLGCLPRYTSWHFFWAFEYVVPEH